MSMPSYAEKNQISKLKNNFTGEHAKPEIKLKKGDYLPEIFFIG